MWVVITKRTKCYHNCISFWKTYIAFWFILASFQTCGSHSKWWSCGGTINTKPNDPTQMKVESLEEVLSIWQHGI